MLMRRTLAAVILPCLAIPTAVAGTNRVTLTGVVTDVAGKPMDHATVLVYHADEKVGYSTFCPSCYTDCGKRATTDSAGAFTISNLSPDLWFELLIVRDGFTPTFVKKVDPTAGPAPAAVLKPRAAVSDPKTAVRGRVLDAHGDPVRDVVVTPFAVQVPRGTIYGMPPGLEPVATTSEQGDFELTDQEAFTKIALMVEARGMAPKFVILPSGREQNAITVSDGAWVRGRLIKDGKPLANAEIAVVPSNPWLGSKDLQMTGSPYQEVRIGTREDGTFAATNIPSPGEWLVYGKMESISSTGTTDPVSISALKDGQEINVGDIEVRPAYKLSGKVTLADGGSIANGMRIYVESDITRDVQSLLLPPDGRFEFDGLAKGTYTLWEAVKGYKPVDNSHSKAVVVGNVEHFDVAMQPKM